MHATITLDRVLEAVERSMSSLDNPGFCLSCGEEQEGCEPDMQHGLCESCGARKVVGAEELLLRMA